LIWSDKF